MRRTMGYLLFTIALGGCFASEGFPDDVIIPCDGAADCPDGYACHPTLGRCIIGSDVDVVLPGATAQIDPPIANLDDVVTIRLDASEALAVDPTLTSSGPDLFAIDETRTDRAGLRWVFTAQLADDGDGPREVRALLRDRQGNDADVAIGSYLVDNTAPYPEVAPTIVSNLETGFGVDVWILLTEETSQPPWIDLAPRVDQPGYHLEVDQLPSAVEGEPSFEWQGVYYRVGDEPLGIYDVILTARDLTGNTNVSILGTVELAELP